MTLLVRSNYLTLRGLQSFEGGNKRTSRLAANIPLMIYNCAPLSFFDANLHDYAYAMKGVYELLDTSLAADLFTWTYRRSIQKYAVVMQSVGAPDPFRLKYREELSVVVNSVVREGRTMVDAISEFTFSDDDKPTS